MFSKILVAFDGSKPSMDAVESAIELGRKYKSTLYVLHVLDSYKYPYLLSSVILAPTFGSDKFEKEREKFQELMDSLKQKYLNDIQSSDQSLSSPGKDSQSNDFFQTAIVEAETSTASTIVDFAESNMVDLIVIGSRGRTGIKKMLLGSTATAVLKYAHCPVFVTR